MLAAQAANKRQRRRSGNYHNRLSFIAACAANIRRAHYNLIVQDKYPETLIAVGKTSPDSMVAKILNKFNIWLYSGAEKIIVVGRDMRELVESQTNVKSGKKKTIEVIQNWASLEEIEPTQREDNKLLKNLGILDKFVFLYAGALQISSVF